MPKVPKGGSKELMINKSEAEELIAKQLDINRLKRIIRNTSAVAWKKEITDEKVENWLSNFDGSFFVDIENEKKLALWLLAHFTYYTLDDVRTLCKNLFNRYLHEKLCNTIVTDMNQAINLIIENTLFVGLGNDSESGNSILYFFRQENHLSKKSFELNTKKQYENLVFIDDVTISGQQAFEYIKSISIDAKNKYVATLIATDEAIEKLDMPSAFIKPIATMILDQRDRAFSDAAYVFSEKRIFEIKDIAQEFCEYYGRRAVSGTGYMEKYPLGYNDGQYMIGFEYNTPDNTLPIFWGVGNDWIPLFKRYPKIYDEKEYVLDGRKYY